MSGKRYPALKISWSYNNLSEFPCISWIMIGLSQIIDRFNFGCFRRRKTRCISAWPVSNLFASIQIDIISWQQIFLSAHSFASPLLFVNQNLYVSKKRCIISRNNSGKQFAVLKRIGKSNEPERDNNRMDRTCQSRSFVHVVHSNVIPHLLVLVLSERNERYSCSQSSKNQNRQIDLNEIRNDSGVYRSYLLL